MILLSSTALHIHSQFIASIITKDNQVWTKFTKLSIQHFQPTNRFVSQSKCHHQMFTLYAAAKWRHTAALSNGNLATLSYHQVSDAPFSCGAAGLQTEAKQWPSPYATCP